jgi:hypothetical protein
MASVTEMIFIQYFNYLVIQPDCEIRKEMDCEIVKLVNRINHNMTVYTLLPLCLFLE